MTPRITLTCPRCEGREFDVEYLESYLHGNVQFFTCLSCGHTFILRELIWETDDLKIETGRMREP